MQHFSGDDAEAEEAAGETNDVGGGGGEDDEDGEYDEYGEGEEMSDEQPGLDANMRSAPWPIDPHTDRSLATVVDTADARLEASLWALAVTIEDGKISDVEKALRAAQRRARQERK